MGKRLAETLCCARTDTEVGEETGMAARTNSAALPTLDARSLNAALRSQFALVRRNKSNNIIFYLQSGTYMFN